MFASDSVFLILEALVHNGPGTLEEVAGWVVNQETCRIEKTLKLNEREGYVACDENGVWSITDAGRKYLDAYVEQRR